VTDNKGASNFAIRIIVREFNIRYSALSRFVTKQRRQEQEVNSVCPRKVTYGYVRPWQMFIMQEEDIFKSYRMISSDIVLGLTSKEVRILACLCAVKHYIRIPPSWAKKWLVPTGFRISSRHEGLSLK
jgi:hypothetical protein